MGLLFLGSQLWKPDRVQILIVGVIAAFALSTIQIYMIPLKKNKIDEIS